MKLLFDLIPLRENTDFSGEFVGTRLIASHLHQVKAFYPHPNPSPKIGEGLEHSLEWFSPPFST
jgi:hypothetical protein